MTDAQITSAAWPFTDDRPLYLRQYPKLKRSQVQHVHDHERITELRHAARDTRQHWWLNDPRPDRHRTFWRHRPRGNYIHTYKYILRPSCPASRPCDDVTPSRCTRERIFPCETSSEARASLLPLISLPTIPRSMCTIHFHGPPLISDTPFTRIRIEIGFWQYGSSNHAKAAIIEHEY